MTRQFPKNNGPSGTRGHDLWLAKERSWHDLRKFLSIQEL